MYIMATWWKPWTWGEAVGDAIDALQGIINRMLVSGTQFSLDRMTGMFNGSINALQEEVAITPNEFSADLVETLQNLSTTVLLPVAGLIITYVFVLQIIEHVTDHNKGNEWNVGSVIMLIIKTAITISLATNAFTIGLAFSDVSTWMIDQVPTEEIELTHEITDDIIEQLQPEVVTQNADGTLEPTGTDEPVGEDEFWDYKLGEAFITMLVGFIGLIITMVISGIIYLVAWSRIIMILLYITVAPIPMATLMSESWVNSIGQNYLKNLLALTLQGFFMLVLLVIYQGLVTRTSTLMQAGEGGFSGMVLLIVSMGIIASMLLKTHGFAKSITGAS